MKEAIQLISLEKTPFYALDKAIKTYRQFAQRNIKAAGFSITIDQWLLLKTIHDHPGMTQKEMAEIVFKDYASVTRMIELLVRKGYLLRTFHPADRRRFELTFTAKGKKTIDQLIPIIQSNRRTALEGLTQDDQSQLKTLLDKITQNCS